MTRQEFINALDRVERNFPNLTERYRECSLGKIHMLLSWTIEQFNHSEKILSILELDMSIAGKNTPWREYYNAPKQTIPRIGRGIANTY